MTKHTDIFVIGTGPSGMAAARTAKSRRPELAVTAIRRERSYVPCALPYALGDEIPVDSYLKDEDKLLTSIGVEVLEGQVEKIEPGIHSLTLDDGSRWEYERLIVATGAEPIRLPGPGSDAPNVFTVRTPADIHRIVAYRKKGMRVVVVGGGYIGVEVACMMRRAGHPVELVELMDCLMPTTLDREFCAAAREQMEAGGVAVHLGAGVETMVVGEDGLVGELALSNGARLGADMVVLALGIKPRLRLFEQAGIRTERDGVVVDDHMRTSAPDVFACGDCTHFHHFVTGQPAQGKLATNAIFQGKVAALNAIGQDRTFDGFINACVTDIFDLRVGAAGLREEDAAQAGIETFTGTGVSRDAYPMFEGSNPVTVKLVFNRANRQLIGGQVVGRRAVAERVDLIALAIHNRLQVEAIAKLQHCAHPLQSGVPAHNPIVMAAEDAARELHDTKQ